MPEITGSAFVMKDANIIIGSGDNDYAALVSSAILTPTIATQTAKGLKPTAVYTDASSATWALSLTFWQDWTSETSLGRYLFENEGELVDIRLDPTDGGIGFELQATIVPGAVGGAVDTFASATVSLPVTGKPTLVPVTP